MQLCKIQLSTGEIRVAVLENQKLTLLQQDAKLSAALHSGDTRNTVKGLIDADASPLALSSVKMLPPVDQQEIWAAGVTYKRSQEARERESAGAARFYDLVYSAPRPELFFKSPASRVVGPNETVHIRRDGRWNVPEPELALVISPSLALVGFTIGNDMSSRDIEGENPLYLPQAKFYDRSCSVGPVITLVDAFPPPDKAIIRLQIERGGRTAFDGQTSIASMKRSFDELIAWLGRETSFPNGAILLTGTGIVPPDEFTLAVGDVVHIEITGIGRLTNTVSQRQA